MLNSSVDEAAARDKSGVGVLDKSVAIVSFLSAEGASSLAEVVEGTGIPRPTAHRLLAALETHHLVARRDGRYALGARLLGWASRVEAGAGLVEAARPTLERLVEETGESAQLYVREGENRVCVASREPVVVITPALRNDLTSLVTRLSPIRVRTLSNSAT